MDNKNEGGGRDDFDSISLSIKQTMIIDDMQIQLTKMQIQCLEERRNYLGLVGNNEQLKFENEEIRRKFQAALLMGKVEEKAVVHFLQKNPKAPQLTDDIIKVNEDIRKCGKTKPVKVQFDNPVVLGKQVAFLETHIERMKEQNLVEIFGLKTSLELTLEERQVMREEYDRRIKDVVTKLEETRTLLHKMTQENLQQQRKFILLENQMAKEHKKLEKRLTQAEEGGCELLPLSDGSSKGKIAGGNKHHKCIPPVQAHLLEKLTHAEIQIMEKENTVKEYEIKFIQMETRLRKVKEDEAATKKACSEMIKKLKAKNGIMERRFNKLDERRKLDNDGFRNDVSALKQCIKSIEKKLHLFMTRRLNSIDQASSVPIGEDIQIDNKRIVSPAEKDDWKPNAKFQIHDARAEENPPSIKNIVTDSTTTTKAKRGKMITNKKNFLNPKSNLNVEPPFEEINHNELNTVEELRDPLEEMERDKLIYELLCKVMESANIKVHEIEKGVIKHGLYEVKKHKELIHH